MKAWAVAVAISAAAAATFGSLAQGGPAAAILDRTFRCSLAVEDGIRTLDVSAYAGARDPQRPSRWRSVARANFSNGTIPDGGLAGVGAGRPAPRDGSAVLWVNGRRCRAAQAGVKLKPRGFPVGGAATQFGDEYECQVGRTILLRVRAELARPAALKRDAAGVLVTRVPLERGTIAARTADGRRLAVAIVSESGSARLHVSAGCLPQ